MQLPHPCLTLSKVHRPTPVRSSQNRGIPWAPWIRRQLPRSLWTFQGHFEQPLGTWQNRAASDRLLLKCFKSKRWTRWHEGQWSESDWRLVETNPCLLHGSKHGPYSFGFAAKSKSPNNFQSLHLPVHSEQASAIAWSWNGLDGLVSKNLAMQQSWKIKTQHFPSTGQPQAACMMAGYDTSCHIITNPKPEKLFGMEHRKDCSKRTGLAIAAHSQSSTAPNNEVSLQSHHVRKLSRLN